MLTTSFIVAQLPQTGYHALQTPYAFFGLGRTNNYVEVSPAVWTPPYVNALNTIADAQRVFFPYPETVYRRISCPSQPHHFPGVSYSQFSSNNQPSLSCCHIQPRREERRAPIASEGAFYGVEVPALLETWWMGPLGGRSGPRYGYRSGYCCLGIEWAGKAGRWER